MIGHDMLGLCRRSLAQSSEVQESLFAVLPSTDGIDSSVSKQWP